MNDDTVVLNAGAARCRIAPALGGSLLEWSVGGNDILRRGPERATSPLQMASFPLIPFANRIRDGRFEFANVVATPGPHPVADPHALHGHGWEANWRMVECGLGHALLVFAHDGDRGWPWPYRASMTIRLEPARLLTGIEIANLDRKRPMPAGAGIHPYFPRTASSEVVALSTVRWDNDDTGLAIRPVGDETFASGGAVSVDTLDGLDHYFPASGDVVVRNAQGAVRIPLKDAAGFHLYVPSGRDHFCVEPVSHPPDALGRGETEAMVALRPGETRGWQFPMEWQAA